MRRVTFIECSVGIRDLASVLSVNCPNLTHLGLVAKANSDPRMQPRFTLYNALTNLIELQISLKLRRPSDMSPSTMPHRYGDVIQEIIRHTPRLQHLFIDSKDFVNHGAILVQALKRCPYLDCFVASPMACVPSPEAVLEYPDAALTTYLPDTPAGLRRLFLTGGEHYIY